MSIDMAVFIFFHNSSEPETSYSESDISFKNSSSLTILTPSFSAFCSFDGPILSPARINEVFELIDPTFLPP